MCVGVVDVKSGAVARYGSGLKFNIPRLAPNGRAVALLNYIKSPVGGRSHYVHDLLAVPVDGHEPHVVAKDVQVDSYASRLSWSPDSEMICFVTGAAKESHHLWVVPADASAEPTMLAAVGVGSASLSGTLVERRRQAPRLAARWRTARFFC